MLLYIFMTEQVTSHWKAEHSHTTSPHSQAWKTIPLVSTSQGLFDSCFWVSKLNLLCAPYISTSGHETRFNYNVQFVQGGAKLWKRGRFYDFLIFFPSQKTCAFDANFFRKTQKSYLVSHGSRIKTLIYSLQQPINCPPLFSNYLSHNSLFSELKTRQNPHQIPTNTPTTDNI